MISRTISIAAGAGLLGGVFLIGQALAQAPAAPAPGAVAGAAPAAGAAGRGGGGRGAPPTTPVPPVPLAPPLARAPITPADYTNSIGMDFMRIKTGTMIAGAYEPCSILPPPPTPPVPVAPAAPAAAGGGRGAAPAAAPAAPSAPDVSPLPPVIPARFSCPTTGAAGGRGGWTPEQYATAEELLRKSTIPGFVVEIKKPYYMGRYEVTQGEWKKVMGANPSVFQGSKVTDNADRHPVDSVTWADAQAFVRKLNQMEKTTAYRLPTEMEWEWAARAGQFRAPSISPGAAGPGESAMAYGSIFQGPTAPVGTRAPNAFGLYDVIGNVWEWVNDFYNEKIVPDAVPPKSGKQHVLKGGSYMAHVNALGSAIHAGGPGEPFVTGFRIVKDIQP